ncbi:MAG: glycosyltransferase [Lachnospiraceae bacterium]|nr:glycosyltransferase [Lachnospiraceae bacterium]
MRILFVEWKSLCQKDMAEEFTRRGWTVDYYQFPRDKENTRLNKELAEQLLRAMAGKNYDFVFSFNYFPVISLACNACQVKYVSWTFDSPFIQLYSNTINFPYNYVFIFDKGTCEDLWCQGVETVYYLPMAAPVERYDQYLLSQEVQRKYQTEIAFIGSTYQEKKNQFYEKLEGIDQHTRGYLEGCLAAQKQLYGSFILERLLKPDVMKELMRVCPLSVNEDGFERLEWVYAHYFLARQITARERSEVLEALSGQHKVRLYTYEQTPHLPRVENCGSAEPLQEASVIYRCAKINLNISLRSILTGIPLRSFEVMGSGGFLLTNYQQDYLEHFVPGEDFVYYESQDDLLEKAEYYLSHEKERKEIARNGYEKIKAEHTFKHRVDEILEVTGLVVR